MLNPFVIEKDTLAKVAAIQEAAVNLRVALSQEILLDYKGATSSIEPGFKELLESYVAVQTPQPNKYTCKLCNKEFNDGRKLGGHVSRAHKKDTDAEIKEEEVEMKEEVSPKKCPKPSRKILKYLRLKEVVKMEQIFQEDD